jgi:hypothetical protein
MRGGVSSLVSSCGCEEGGQRWEKIERPAEPREEGNSMGIIPNKTRILIDMKKKETQDCFLI